MGSTLGALKGTGMAIRVSHMVRTELDLGEEDKSHLPAHRDECTPTPERRKTYTRGLN
jgi:hypothetical protein